MHMDLFASPVSRCPGLIETLAVKRKGQASLDRLMEQVRNRCPIVRDDPGGSFIVTGYEEARDILADPCLWRDPERAAVSEHFQRRFADDLDPSVPRSEATAIVLLDDPDHGRLRRPLALALLKRLNSGRDRILSGIRNAVACLPDSDPFDIVTALARQVPIGTIGLLLGVDPDRMDQFRDWSEGILLSLNPYRSPDEQVHLDQARHAVDAYFVEQIALCERQDRDDLIGDLVRLRRDGLPISDGELRTNLAALLLGGNLTTADLISGALFLTLKAPGEWQRLRNQPSHALALVEETLRLEPPIDITSRIASRDMEVCGVQVSSGQALMLSLRTANRDPRIFAEPDRFRPGQHRARALSFGGGSHMCIGSQMARLEAQAVLGALAELRPDLRLCDPEDRGDWHAMPFFRGLKSLRVQP